ncbi:MAG: MauE/DoxX family redox-associated membrane protein [Mucilaginibacter sp.]
MTLLKKVSLVILVIGYLAAGANHFRAPESYIHIIPPYIPLPKLVNLLAGVFEILFGLLLIFEHTRKLAAWGIILMLIAFLPVHIDMVIRAPFQLSSLYITPLIAWVRLVVLQPLLIWWAWWYTRE